MSYLHLLNLDTIGGVEELFVHFLENAKKLSFAQQHILVTGQKPHPLFQERLAYADSITFEKYLLGMKLPEFLRGFQRKLSLKKSHPDAIILWNRLEASIASHKLIYYEHGASWIEPQSTKLEGFFKSVDAILANSHAAKRLLELKWNVQSPISVIENPLKPSLQAAILPKTAPSKVRLGYIGRLIPLKGVSLILHAIKQIKDVEVSLAIAGDGPEKQALMNEAKRLDLEVAFLGVQKDVSAFYDDIDILIVPSIREPLGLVAQEAALRGCPVICSCVDGLPEVVKNNVTGLCLTPSLSIEQYREFGGSLQKLPDLVYDPQKDALTSPRLIDPKELAAAIVQIVQDPASYTQMSRQAIEFAKKRPNFIEYTQKLLATIGSKPKS